MDSLPPDYFVTSMQFTPHVYQDQYPSIDPTSPNLSLAGKTVIITGASRGVGAKGFVPAFAKAGVKGIVLVATDAAKLKAVEEEAKKINPKVQTLAVSTDISSNSSVDALFEKIKDTFGHADVLVNNAGVVAEGDGALLADIDPETWWRGFEINAKGPYLMSRGFLRALPSTDIPATIINLTTGAAWQVFANMSSYSIAKLAALQQVQYIAAGYPNVMAVALHPGLVDTDMMLEAFRPFIHQSPELIGGMGVWLSHPHAKFLSGTTLCSWWSVDDLVARKAEILEGKVLRMELAGKFGPEQFH